MEHDLLFGFAIALAALGIAALLGPLAVGVVRRQRAARVLDAVLRRRAGATAAGAQPAPGAPARPAASPRGDAAAPADLELPAQTARDGDWLDTPLGRAAVGQEEARLLAQCGLSTTRARVTFGVARWLAPVMLAAMTLVWRLPQSAPGAIVAAFCVFAAGFLLFKIALRRCAMARQRRIDDELPVLVDMLRLLQGVGMSIDQSLQLIVAEFGAMLPVLGPELRRANDQFASGRGREQTLQRIARLFDSEELRGLILLLMQVDRFGGAVQEPLRLFGERLQEGRKMRLKEKVGQLTVKMTGVMVVSLLPVLLIVTAGPGFLGVVRTMNRLGGMQ